MAVLYELVENLYLFIYFIYLPFSRCDPSAAAAQEKKNLSTNATDDDVSGEVRWSRGHTRHMTL